MAPAKLLFLKTLIIVLLASQMIQAQDCSPVAFTTQSQVDDFSIDYPGCTNLTSGLQILCSGTNAITNLDGLSQITSISGGWGLDIESCPGLTSIDGLMNLTSIEGQLYVLYNNDGLTDLSALANVSFVSVDNVEIALNDNLSMCIYTGVCEAVENNNVVDISGNATGCNSEVIAGCTGLAVELISLTVENKNDQVNIVWEIGSEEDTDYYLIETSEDTRDWSPRGIMDASGNDLYSFSFESPYPSLYIRLSEFELNGNKTILGIEHLKFDKFDSYIFPNPTNDFVYLSNTFTGDLEYNIYDSYGQLLLSGVVDKNSKVDVSSLNTTGLYVIEYIHPTTTFYHSFIKKR